jgi:ketosteroid isomerase-like protein
VYRRRIIEAVVQALSQRDAARLGVLLHPDVEIRETQARISLHGRDEVVAYVESLRHRIGSVTVTTVEEVGKEAALVEGREQCQNADLSIFDVPMVWIVRFRDELIWQSLTCHSRDHAAAALD